MKDYIRYLRDEMRYFLKIIFVVVFSIFLFAGLSHAGNVTFIKEYTYQASELDSKHSCRTIALEMVKRLLLEELGTYLISETEVKDLKLTKEQVTIYTSGIVHAKIIKEKWNGKTYWLKVKIMADPAEVERSIRALKEKHELHQELIIAKQKTDSVLNESERLREKAKTITSSSEKLKLQKEYEEKVNTLNYVETWMKGVIALYKENYDEAINNAKKMVGDKDGILLCGAYVLLGQAYHKKGMYDNAVATLVEIPKLCPTSKFLPRAHYSLGIAYMKMENEEKAIVEHKKALSLLYNEKKILADKCPPAFPEGKGFMCTTEWNNQIDEDIADNHIALSGAYFSRRARLLGASSTDEVLIPEESWAEIEKVLALKPNSFRHLEQADKLLADKNKYWHDMLAWCEKLIVLQSNNVNRGIYYLRGQYNLSGENYQQAINDFSKAIDYTPQNSEKHISRGGAYYFRGLSYYQIGNYSQAIKDFNRAIAINPTYYATYYTRGRSYDNLGNYQQSIGDYTIAIELKPDYAEAYHSRGFAYGKLGNIQQFIKDLQIAARLGHKLAQDALLKMGKQW